LDFNRCKRHIACDEPFYFINGSSRAHFAAPRFQITTATLGCDLILGANLQLRSSIDRHKRHMACGGFFLPKRTY